MPPVTPHQNMMRNVLRTVFLLGVFGASVAAAWFIAVPDHEAIAAAGEAIQTIRAQGLDAFWGAAPISDWYLTTNSEGKTVGWRYYSRSATLGDEGAVTGYEIEEIQLSLVGPEPMMYRMTVRLNADASVSNYEGWSQVVAKRHGRIMPVVTESVANIQLNGERIEVAQRILDPESGDRPLFRSADRAPSNYMPEGTGNLLFYLVGKRQARAEFRMIVDGQRPSGTRPKFVRHYANYAGQVGEDDTQIDVQLVSPGGHGTVMTFDANGTLLRQTGPGGVTEKVDEQDVLQHFPEAVRLVEEIVNAGSASSKRFVLPAEALPW